VTSQKIFNNAELGVLDEALKVAEDRVSDHYHLTQTAWAQYPYEVRTGAELLPLEMSENALAQVLRLRQPLRPGRLRPWDFYRICVQDHNLLDLMERESVGHLLLPLMTYVLTHELVHVVRFYKFLHLFDSDPSLRAEEEALVHRISTGILGQVKLPNLDRVLNLYETHGLYAAKPAWSSNWLGSGDHADLRV
jgi:hypothetical protein